MDAGGGLGRTRVDNGRLAYAGWVDPVPDRVPGANAGAGPFSQGGGGESFLG